MGRKGMKSFLKGVHKHHDSDEEAAGVAAEQPGTSASKHAAAPGQSRAPKSTQLAMAEPADKANDSAEGDDDDSEDDGGDTKGQETRGQLLQRHKREMTAHKKTIQKLGSKKKDDAAKLTSEIEARHARELAELQERERQQPGAAAATSAGARGGGGAGSSGGHLLAGDGGDGGTADHPHDHHDLGCPGLVGSDHPWADAKKPSKAQKRREKLAQQDAERERRIASELAALGPSDKAVEEEQLQELLLPLKLSIREIRADGHCLYRSIEDQLTQQAQAAAAATATATAVAGRGAAVPDYLALRRLAASHIRSKAADFLPFIYDEDRSGSPEEQLESYCEELGGSAVWGGQLELGALAQALKKQIKVYAAGLPIVTMGDEHADQGVLQLCYLRHAFGLGEHYNSVVPVGSPAGALPRGEEDD